MERKEGNVLFNDALNSFYLRLYGVGLMVKDHSDGERGNRLAAKVPSHRQDSAYHSLCKTSRGVDETGRTLSYTGKVQHNGQLV